MKYFIDTEFIEGFHKPLFGKKRHFIDLISIGIVAEDGRELYLVSKDFNPNDADEWVHKNVLSLLYDEMRDQDYHRFKRDSGYVGFPAGYTPKSLKNILNRRGVSNKEIKEIIKGFVNGGPLQDLRCGWKGKNEEDVVIHNPNEAGNAQPDFYAYYADYDWVVFCSLFGRMIDLPNGFPMYCNDLKQTLDEKQKQIQWEDGTIPMSQGSKSIKDMLGYPDQNNEHNALADAKWNKKLYDFLQTL